MIYPVLLVVGVWGALELRYDAQDELDRLVARIRADEGAALCYRGEASYFAAFPGRSYTMSLYVGSDDRFAPARFLILTRIDGAGELQLVIPNPGGRRSLSEVYRGPDVARYLERTGLDVSGLAELFATHYSEPRPGVPVPPPPEDAPGQPGLAGPGSEARGPVAPREGGGGDGD